jgi:hypothetical protein
MRAKFYYLQSHALAMLSLAIYHGDLTPASNCEKCGVSSGERALHGHHEDYSQPLDVVWLCSSCHRTEHNRDGEYFFKRPAKKMKKALTYLREHPEDMDTESRALGGRIGVSHTLANEAKKLLKAEQERAAVRGTLPAAGVEYKVSSNGHKTTEAE